MVREGKGIKMAREFYEQVALPLVETKFGAYTDRIAFGLVGEGSECFGFDDQWSEDHDYGPGVCMWLTDEDYRAIGQSLNQAYREVDPIHPPFRRGAIPITSFYAQFTGLRKPPETIEQWRAIPEEFLATATNGVVFCDSLGMFSQWRNRLFDYYPEDLRVKKLSFRAAKMAQAGQYNLPRLLKRGEYVAAQMALGEFLNNASSFVYVANKQYKPFYKWAHRGMGMLDQLQDVAKIMEESALRSIADQQVVEDVERICVSCAQWLREQDLTISSDNFLIPHSEQLLQRIKDEQLRNSNIMAE